MMNVRSFLFLIITLFFAKISFANDTIIIHKDARLDLLTQKQIQINKHAAMLNSTGQYKGFRVQIMSTGNRDEAFKIKADLLTKFPDQKSYTIFQSPNYKIRIGNFLKKEDAENSGIVCDKCGAPMVVKRGRFGAFLGCSKYPECKNIMNIEQKTGVKCPKCQVGDVIARKSKKGKMFYGCNKYPACDFVMWNKPTGEACPKCSQPLAFAAKGKITCSNKECKFTKDAEDVAN